MRTVVLMVLLGVGCATAPPPAPPPPPPAVDLTAAQNTVAEMMRASYTALEHGDADAFFARVLPGGFVYGPSTSQWATSRNDALAEWREQLGKHLTIKSTALVVTATSDGRAAWISDVLEVAADGKPATPLRVAAVAAESDHQWWLTALDWSAGVTGAAAAEIGRAGKLKPVKLPESVAPGATAVVAAYDRGLARFEDLLDALSPRPETIFFGLGVEDRMDGTSIKDVLLEQHKTMNLLLRRLGPIHADVTPNGRLAYIAGAVEVTLPSKDRVPARSLWVYQNEGGMWRVVLAHLSLPVEGVLR